MRLRVIGLCAALALGGCANLQSGLNTALNDVQNAQQKVTSIPPTAVQTGANVLNDAFSFTVDAIRVAIAATSFVKGL